MGKHLVGIGYTQTLALITDVKTTFQVNTLNTTNASSFNRDKGIFTICINPHINIGDMYKLHIVL